MLIRLARSVPGKWCIGWMFEHMNSVLPVDRIYETPLLLAFYHPKPVYPLHVLIVPKKAIRDILDLTDQPAPYRDELMEDLLCCVGELVTRFKLEDRGYRLIVNGGDYQEVSELHFHLVSGDSQTGT